jgi:hypothetical protein
MDSAPTPERLRIRYKIGLKAGIVDLNGWSDWDADDISRRTKAEVERIEGVLLFGVEYYEVISREKRKL